MIKPKYTIKDLFNAMDKDGIRHYEKDGRFCIEGGDPVKVSAYKNLLGRPDLEAKCLKLQRELDAAKKRENLPSDRVSYTKWAREYERRKAQAVASSNAEQRRRGMIGSLEHGHEHTQNIAEYEAQLQLCSLYDFAVKVITQCYLPVEFPGCDEPVYFTLEDVCRSAQKKGFYITQKQAQGYINILLELPFDKNRPWLKSLEARMNIEKNKMEYRQTCWWYMRDAMKIYQSNISGRYK